MTNVRDKIRDAVMDYHNEPEVDRDPEDLVSTICDILKDTWSEELE
jgi:hypothetical protein